MSEKLRKYLAYYQRVLKDEPENLEARLRLAAIFRQMGRDSHAVAEYVTASKLLAAEGLPLEAIAACKAVLELEPNHSEVQFFLARLFAQVPDATGESLRVARPLDPMVARQTPARAMPSSAITSKGGAPLDDQTPITLDKLKPGEATKRRVVPDGDIDEVEPETLDSLAAEETSPLDLDADNDDSTTSPLPREDLHVLDEYSDVDEGELLDTTTRPVRPLDPNKIKVLLEGDDVEEFEVNVFDMESLELSDSDVEFEFLENFEGEVGEFTASEISESIPAVFRVNRESLPKIPLLSELPAEAFAGLLPLMDLQKVPAGQVILSPGHDSRTLYIIVRGEIVVTREFDDATVELARMQEGEFFGEFRLLTGRSGAASVLALSDCELLAIHENVVTELGDRHPEVWDALWDFYYQRMLNNLLAGSAIFRPLGAEGREAIARKFELQEVVADEAFIHEGDACRHLHLIVNGEVVVERQIGSERKELLTLREGEFFGLASCLNDEPYLADVRAVRDTTILRLPSEDFRELADSNEEVDSAVQLAIMSRRELNSAFVSGVTAYAEYGVAKVE